MVCRVNPGLPVAFVPARGRELPPALAARPGVSQTSAADAQTRRDPLIVATVDKLADAHLRAGLGGFDFFILDEAFQADASQTYTAGFVANTHFLVGDGGQLDPFSTLPDATFWRGGPEDPLQTAVGVLLRNHPHTPVHRLPITRRLDPTAGRLRGYARVRRRGGLRGPSAAGADHVLLASLPEHRRRGRPGDSATHLKSGPCRNPGTSRHRPSPRGGGESRVGPRRTTRRPGTHR